MTAQGFDSIEVQKVDTNKYRIVLTGEGLTVDAMLFGVGAELIASAITGGVHPAEVIKQLKAKRAVGGK